MTDNPITNYFKNKDKNRKKQVMTNLQKRLYAFLKTNEGNNLFWSLLHANDETLAIELSKVICAEQGCNAEKIQVGHFLNNLGTCICCGREI